MIIMGGYIQKMIRKHLRTSWRCSQPYRIDRNNSAKTAANSWWKNTAQKRYNVKKSTCTKSIWMNRGRQHGGTRPNKSITCSRQYEPRWCGNPAHESVSHDRS